MSKQTDTLTNEYQEFEKERQQIRDLIGQIGGVRDSRIDSILNVAFFLVILAIFGSSALQHFFHFELSFSPIFSLEIGVLLVSLKIIWMIHRQTKVEHFQFWILNSIEFRLNEVAKDIREMRNKMENDR